MDIREFRSMHRGYPDQKSGNISTMRLSGRDPRIAADIFIGSKGLCSLGIGHVMSIRAFGPFEFDKTKVRDKSYVSDCWDAVDQKIPGLSEACGVYIFSLRNASNFVPVYVGQASSASSFRRRVFSDDKFRTTIKYFEENKGVMVVKLLARPLPIREGFAVISDDEVDFLETFCIICSMRKNEKITNVSKTRLSERMTIPGLTGNLGQGHPGSAILALRNCFEMD